MCPRIISRDIASFVGVRKAALPYQPEKEFRQRLQRGQGNPRHGAGVNRRSKNGNFPDARKSSAGVKSPPTAPLDANVAPPRQRSSPVHVETNSTGKGNDYLRRRRVDQRPMSGSTAIRTQIVTGIQRELACRLKSTCRQA